MNNRNSLYMMVTEPSMKISYGVNYKKSNVGSYIATESDEQSRQLISYRVVEDYPLIMIIEEPEQFVLQEFIQRRNSYYWFAAMGSLAMIGVGGLLLYKKVQKEKNSEFRHWADVKIQGLETRYELLIHNMSNGFAYCKAVKDNRGNMSYPAWAWSLINSNSATDNLLGLLNSSPGMRNFPMS